MEAPFVPSHWDGLVDYLARVSAKTTCSEATSMNGDLAAATRDTSTQLKSCPIPFPTLPANEKGTEAAKHLASHLTLEGVMIGGGI